MKYVSYYYALSIWAVRQLIFRIKYKNLPYFSVNVAFHAANPIHTRDKAIQQMINPKPTLDPTAIPKDVTLTLDPEVVSKAHSEFFYSQVVSKAHSESFYSQLRRK